MSASNNRTTLYSTYHHLMSRIAHQVYFLTEDVRDDFIEIIRRSAEFHGIKLIAWCIMTNHFHLLAYLPTPEILTEEEIVRRYGVLYGTARQSYLITRLSKLRTLHPNDNAPVQAELAKLTGRMYKISEFMKVIKQWLTQEYNRRFSHKGTLWDAVYKDVSVSDDHSELAKRAAYIHLNPVRAAITPKFDAYPWSSLSALKKGDEMAQAGMRAIYGEEITDKEMLQAHKHLMAELLEQHKLERALQIAQRRRAGFNVEADPLTSEAMIAQATAQIEASQSAGVADDVIRREKRGRPVNEDFEKGISRLMSMTPALSPRAIAESIGCSVPTVYRYMKKVKSDR